MATMMRPTELTDSDTDDSDLDVVSVSPLHLPSPRTSADILTTTKPHPPEALNDQLTVDTDGARDPTPASSGTQHTPWEVPEIRFDEVGGKEAEDGEIQIMFPIGIDFDESDSESRGEGVAVSVSLSDETVVRESEGEGEGEGEDEVVVLYPADGDIRAEDAQEEEEQDDVEEDEDEDSGFVLLKKEDLAYVYPKHLTSGKFSLHAVTESIPKYVPKSYITAPDAIPFPDEIPNRVDPLVSEEKIPSVRKSILNRKRRSESAMAGDDVGSSLLDTKYVNEFLLNESEVLRKLCIQSQAQLLPRSVGDGKDPSSVTSDAQDRNDPWARARTRSSSPGTTDMTQGTPLYQQSSLGGLGVDENEITRFPELVRAWIHCCERVGEWIGKGRQLASQIADSQVWVIQETKETVPLRNHKLRQCGCGGRARPIEQEITHQTACWNPVGAQRAHQLRKEKREAHFGQLEAWLFERAVWKRRIEECLDRIFSQPGLREAEGKELVQVRLFERMESREEAVVASLRSLIRDLFHFEKVLRSRSAEVSGGGERGERKETGEDEGKTEEQEEEQEGEKEEGPKDHDSDFGHPLAKYVNDCWDTVRKWIRQALGYLLRVATVDDHRFIVFELIRCQGVGDWAVDLLQVPSITTDDAVDFFVATLSVFLRPSNRPIDAVSPMYVHSYDASSSSPSSPDVAEGFVVVPTHRRSSAQELFLTESDYCLMWRQFPVFELVEYLFVRCKNPDPERPRTRFQDWRLSFHVMETILSFVDRAISSFNRPSYRVFAREIAQSVVRLCNMVGSILSEIGLLRTNDFVRKCYDRFFVRAFDVIYSNESVDLRLWYFLAGFPYQTASIDACFSLFLNCFDLNYDDFNGLACFDVWVRTLVENPGIRDGFESLVMLNSHSSQFLVAAFAGMARTAGELSEFGSAARRSLLAAAVALEVFHLLVAAESDSLLSNGFLGSLELVCESSPSVVVPLIARLVVAQFDKVGHYAVSLIQRFVSGFFRWVPDDEDLIMLSYLFSKSCKSREYNLGRFFVSHINTTICSAFLQRKLCNVLIRGLRYLENDSTKTRKDADSYRSFFWVVLKRMNILGEDGIALLPPLSTAGDKALESLNSLVDSSFHPHGEFDSVLAYAVFLFADAGRDVRKFSVAVRSNGPSQIARPLPDVLIYSKLYEEAIRVMCEASLLMLGELALDFRHNISALLSVTDTYAEVFGSLLGKKTVGMKAKILVQTIGMFFSRIWAVNQDRAVAFLCFWLRQFLQLSQFQTRKSALYCIDELCRVAFTARAHLTLIPMLLDYSELSDFGLARRGLLSFSPGSYPSNLFSFPRKYVVGAPEFPFLLLLLNMGLLLEKKRSRIEFATAQLFPLTQRVGEMTRKISREGSSFVIYRIIAQCLLLGQFVLTDEDQPPTTLGYHSCMVLFWQMFLRLYLESHQAPGEKRSFCGYLFLQTTAKGVLAHEMSECLGRLTSWYASQIVMLKQQAGSESKLALFEKLQVFYSSLSSWMSLSFAELLHSYTHDELASDPSFGKFCEMMRWDNEFGLWFDFVDCDGMRARRATENQELLSSLFPTIPLRLAEERENARRTHALRKSLSLSIRAFQTSTSRRQPLPPAFRTRSQRCVLSDVDIETTTFPEIRSYVETRKDILKGLNQLEIRMQNYLPQLCRNATRTDRVLYSCRKGASCNSPIAQNHQFRFVDRIPAVQKAIDDLEQSYLNILLLSQRNATSDALVLAVLSYERSVDMVIGCRDFSSGLKWLYRLHELSISFPFILHLFERNIGQIVKEFVRTSPRENARFFHFMIEREERILQLVKFFQPDFPNYVPFLERFVMIEGFRPDSLLLVLGKFDMPRYLAEGSADVEELRRLMRFSLIHLSRGKEFSKAFFMKTFLLLFHDSLPGMLLDGLRVLLESFDSIPEDLIRGVVNSIQTDDLRGRQVLNDRQLCADLAEVFHSCLWSVRNMRGGAFLYDLCPHSAEFAELIRRLFLSIVIDDQLGRESVEVIFVHFCRALEPFLMTLKVHSPTSSGSSTVMTKTVYPCDSERHLISYRAFVKCLFDLVRYILTENGPNILFSLFYNWKQWLYPNSPDALLAEINEQMFQLDWSRFAQVFREETIADFEGFVAAALQGRLKGGRSLEVVRHLLESIDWEEVCSRNRFMSSSYQQLALLYLSLSLLQCSPRNLSSLIQNVPWKCLELVHFSSLLTFVGVKMLTRWGDGQTELLDAPISLLQASSEGVYLKSLELFKWMRTQMQGSRTRKKSYFQQSRAVLFRWMLDRIVLMELELETRPRDVRASSEGSETALPEPVSFFQDVLVLVREPQFRKELVSVALEHLRSCTSRAYIRDFLSSAIRFRDIQVVEDGIIRHVCVSTSWSGVVDRFLMHPRVFDESEFAVHVLVRSGYPALMHSRWLVRPEEDLSESVIALRSFPNTPLCRELAVLPLWFHFIQANRHQAGILVRFAETLSFLLSEHENTLWKFVKDRLFRTRHSEQLETLCACLKTLILYQLAGFHGPDEIQILARLETAKSILQKRSRRLVTEQLSSCRLAIELTIGAIQRRQRLEDEVSTEQDDPDAFLETNFEILIQTLFPEHVSWLLGWHKASQEDEVFHI